MKIILQYAIIHLHVACKFLCNANSRISEEAYLVEIRGHDKLVQRSDPQKERGPDRSSPQAPDRGRLFYWQFRLM